MYICFLQTFKLLLLDKIEFLAVYALMRSVLTSLFEPLGHAAMVECDNTPHYFHLHCTQCGERQNE